MAHLGKSFLILFSILILQGCSTKPMHYTSHSTQASANSEYMPTTGSVSTLNNFFKWQMYKMDSEDQAKQERAVFFALENSRAGETITWYNPNNHSRGVVHVWAEYPQGSGFCKVIATQITYKNKVRDFKETACINSIVKEWYFIR